MSGRLRTRLNHLEQRRPEAPHVSIWGLLSGAVNPADLDPGELARLKDAVHKMLAESEEARRVAVETSPAMATIREQRARLGLPDTGLYLGDDIIEEALRLVALPTPAANVGSPVTEPPFQKET